MSVYLDWEALMMHVYCIEKMFMVLATSIQGGRGIKLKEL